MSGVCLIDKSLELKLFEGFMRVDKNHFLSSIIASIFLESFRF